MRKPAGSMRDAVDAARGADAALVFVGVSRSTDTEGYDRPDMTLWGDQDTLVAAVAEANPNTIVVLQNGGPMAMPWLDRVKAVLTAWLPGQEGSDAIARVLTGAVVPSGKLPHTVPARLEDNPTFIHYPGTRDADYGEGVFVGYRYYDKKRIQPLFPFGFGLSYSRFGYANLVCASTLGRDGAIVVEADVTNLGAWPAAETVQLYVEPLSPSEARPLRELKGFRKVALAPGETRTVRFGLSERDFAYYDVHEGGWRAEPGRYAIHVGGSSRDLPLRREIVIEG
jgi:beta-glucosidase